MKLLLDTNLLLRLGDTSHPMHGEAFAAIDWLDSHQHEGVIVPQVLYEYWVVATRPLDKNGLGMEAQSAEQAIAKWIAAFPLLLDEPAVFGLWRDLVTTHQVLGKNAHDARLVAAMLWHDVTSLVTFNATDFLRFPEIHVFTPEQILTGQLTV